MGDVLMPDMPESFAEQWQAAAEEEAQNGLVPSLVDQAIGDVLATAGVTDSDVPAPDQAPVGDEPVGEPPTTPQEPAAPEPGTEPEPEPEPEGGEVPPVPPGGPIFPEPEPGDQPPPPAPAGDQPVTLPDGRILTPAQLAAYAELDRRIATDPAFRQGISELLNPSSPSGTGTEAAAATRDLPPFPQLSQEDLDNPAIQALIIVAERQRQETARLAEEIQQTRQGLTQREQRDHADIVNGAVSAFQRTHNLPDDLMGEIRQHASRSNAMELYLAGTDPRTGGEVTPDPYKAVEVALELGYWATPRARRFEFDRQATQRGAAQSRKQKLAGIGGTSGSGPRNPAQPDLSTEQGREQAAIAMLSAAIYGGEDEGA